MSTSEQQDQQPLLQVTDLRTYFNTEDGIVKAVDGVNLHVSAGEVLGLVGESGSGKSVASLSIMRLIGPPGEIVSGEIIFDGQSVRDLSVDEMVQMRGDAMAMIFQQPQSSLNPVHTTGAQVGEVFFLHSDLDKTTIKERTVEMFRVVGIPDPDEKVNAYPHEMSGGQAQRVMIAMGLSLSPKLLIADEPTTALDVTIQAQIMDLMRNLTKETDTAVILITHDLGVIAEMADRVAVMYAGQIVEEAEVESLFARPLHPYTQGLIKSIPVLGTVKDRLDTIPGNVPNLVGLAEGCHFSSRCQARIDHGLTACTTTQPELTTVMPGRSVQCWLYQDHADHEAPLSATDVLAPTEEEATSAPRPSAVAVPSPALPADQTPALVEVDNLVKHYSIRGGLLKREVGVVKAVDGVSFTIREGETLGMVGESGCGKSTIGRTMLRLDEPTSGSVRFDGQDVFGLSRKEMRALRRNMQVVLQDPFSSLNPRRQIGQSVADGLKIHKVGNSAERDEMVVDMLRKVGLEDYHAMRYPHEFSGGQRQRIGIARALALQPKLIICDEPVSALDVSIQSQVLNLLDDLQQEFGLTYLVVAHDLSVVEHISDRVAIMYLGKMVELADADVLFADPLHPYTQSLISAVPIADPTRPRNRTLLQGDVPSPTDPPPGCRFQTRCPVAVEHCREEEPPFVEKTPDHFVACWLVD